MAYCIDRAIYRANKAKTIVARDSPLDMIVEGALAPPASYRRGGGGAGCPAPAAARRAARAAATSPTSTSSNAARPSPR